MHQETLELVELKAVMLLTPYPSDLRRFEGTYGGRWITFSPAGRIAPSTEAPLSLITLSSSSRHLLQLIFFDLTFVELIARKSNTQVNKVVVWCVVSGDHRLLCLQAGRWCGAGGRCMYKTPLVLQFHGYPGASLCWFEQSSFLGLGCLLIALG